jgi:cytochrome c oxidase subunit IV
MSAEYTDTQLVDPQSVPADHMPHKSPNYILIFVWLIVITAAEVGVGYIPPEILPVIVTYPVLLIMSAAKILLVVLYFMHLRYDNKWFSIHMLAALPLSVVFILAMVLGFARK